MNSDSPAQRVAGTGQDNATNAGQSYIDPKVSKKGGSERQRNPTLISTDEIDEALSGEFKKAGTSLGFRLSLFVLTLFLILLPAVYLAITLGVAWGTYVYAVQYTDVFSGGSLYLGAIQYLTPILAGIFLFAFLLRPLFSRREPVPAGLVLNEKSTATFSHFVHSICAKVGARRPSEIQISMRANASASIPGFFGLLGSAPKLEVGLPLIVCMNTRELAGVLAHEFGHFNQRASMRAYFVMYNVNRWFHRCVYEQDEWHDSMDELQERFQNAIVTLAVLIASIGSFLVKYLLLFLMHFAHFLSMSMLRKMEFDADKFEILLAGSEQFSKTTRTLYRAEAATSMAMQQLFAREDQKFVDNVAELIAVYIDRLPEQIDGQIEQDIEAARSSTWDSHPPALERIQQAEKLSMPGIFELSKPARDLFEFFDEVGKSVTMQLYREHGLSLNPNQLVPVKGEMKVAQDGLDDQAVFSAYSNHWYIATATWRFPAPKKLSALDPQQLRSLLEKTIAKLRQAGPESSAAFQRFEHVVNGRLEYRLAHMASEVKEDYKLKPPFASLEEWQDKVEADYKATLQSISSCNALFGYRSLAAILLSDDLAEKKRLLITMKYLSELRKVESQLVEGGFQLAMLKYAYHQYHFEEQALYVSAFNRLNRDLYQCTATVAQAIKKIPANIVADKTGAEFLESRKLSILSQSGDQTQDLVENFLAVQSCFMECNQTMTKRLAKAAANVERKQDIQPLKIDLSSPSSAAGRR